MRRSAADRSDNPARCSLVPPSFKDPGSSSRRLCLSVKMVEVSKTDRLNKKDLMMAVAMEHSNRPQEPAHAKADPRISVEHCVQRVRNLSCRRSPLTTASVSNAEAPVVTLILFGASTEGTNTWPGRPLPAAGRFSGRHR